MHKIILTIVGTLFVLAPFFPLIFKAIPNGANTSLIVSMGIYTALITIIELEESDVKLGKKNPDNRAASCEKEKKLDKIKPRYLIYFSVFGFIVSYFLITFFTIKEEYTHSFSEAIALITFGLYIFKFTYIEHEERVEIKKNVKKIKETLLSIMSHFKIGIFIIAIAPFIFIKWILGKLFANNR